MRRRKPAGVSTGLAAAELLAAAPPGEVAELHRAIEVRDELAQRYGVRRERLIELFNEQATRQNIAYALFRLSNEASLTMLS